VSRFPKAMNMKPYILALARATAPPGQHVPLPQEVAERLIAKERKETTQFFVGKGIERAFEHDGKFIRVRLGIEPGPTQSGYNVLELICSDKPLQRWPKEAGDVAGKTLEYFADYQLDNHTLETASTMKDGKKGEYHFYLLGDKQKKPTTEEYNTRWEKYYSILQSIRKKLSD